MGTLKYRGPRGGGSVVSSVLSGQSIDCADGTERAVFTAMVKLNVALRARSARDAFELLETLRYLMASTRSEPGNLECSAWTERDGTVHYAESWSSEADVRRRIRSSGFTSLLGVMECATAPPLVQFDFVAATRGLDFVEEVRCGVGEKQ